MVISLWNIRSAVPCALRTCGDVKKDPFLSTGEQVPEGLLITAEGRKDDYYNQRQNQHNNAYIYHPSKYSFYSITMHQISSLFFYNLVIFLYKY